MGLLLLLLLRDVASHFRCLYISLFALFALPLPDMLPCSIDCALQVCNGGVGTGCVGGTGDQGVSVAGGGAIGMRRRRRPV